ncbi:MAG: hypothetical protein Kow00107_00330 [Planctomycetota bacterium]
MQVPLEPIVFEVVKRASTVLPPDVIRALEKAHSTEQEGSTAKMAFEAILSNCKLADENAAPICQDTGWPTFYVSHPFGWSTSRMKREIDAAVARAAGESLLRPNAVDPVSGKNTGNCVGTGIPTVYFTEWESDKVKIELILKGGGCENVSTQFSLPYAKLGAGRDLDGVRKVVLQAVYDAQGRGCGPCILGIGIGGDRAYSYALAKKQLLRHVDDTNPDKELAELEQRIVRESNSLGIGPMGFGGENTVLAAKIGVASRHPASFFVSVAYFCWASRRASVEIHADGSYIISQ